MNIINVDINKWKQAQHEEFLVWHNLFTDDDWNNWWAKQFENYEFLKDFKINTIAEVGCGPFAKNIQIIINKLNTKPISGMLNDPLLEKYIQDNKPVSKIINKKVTLNSCPLEEIPLNEKYDCIICINVLNHVYDVNKCMDNMYNILNPNGILILGEDLTNDEDLILAPEILTDKLHFIRFTEEVILNKINKYDKIIYKTLPREEGRNPRAHYKTILFCGRKII